MTMKSLPSPCILVKRSSISGLGQQGLAGKQFRDCLPTAHQMGDGILDHHFGGAGAGVVVGTHHEAVRSEEHTSELQSRPHLVCRLLLEKKKKQIGEPRTREIDT